MCIILQKNPVDHITDHLPFRSTRKQWTGERRRARFSERKGAEKVIFSGNCPYRFVWDHQAAGSIPVTRTKILTESRVYSPLSVIFYAYLGALPPLLEKSYSTDHTIKCGLKIPFSLFTAAQNLKSQTSNRRGFFRGGIVYTLRRLSGFESFFLGGDFSILFSNHHRQLFFAFFSCVGVDIKLFAFAVWQFWRIAAFPFLFADSKYAPRSRTAYLRLFRLKFRSYGRLELCRVFVRPRPKCPHFCRNPVQFCRRRSAAYCH